jgi:hypothetical protein
VLARLFKKENSRLDGSDGALYLWGDLPWFHSCDQYLAQHIVVRKRPTSACRTRASHFPFAFSRRAKDRFSQ